LPVGGADGYSSCRFVVEDARVAEVDASERSTPFRDIFTVSRLNLEARKLLEGSFARIWIEGEISNLARPRSGHIYFSLKDEQCQVRCAMFRTHNRQLAFTPENGQQVLAQARVSLYPERGDFQLIVQYLEEAGAGALRRAFDALKQRLAAEGLFDEAHKRPLPTLPRRIGVLSSPTGAALRDIVSVLARRFAAVPVLVYPVPVQGAEAAPEIVRMLDLANARAECDVLILARGGGSLEDLWAFNEESVARALRRSEIPVITGIGHEVDITIADFAADRRAATPSAAAELVSPDAAEWRQQLAAALARLARHVTRRVMEDRRTVAGLARRLQHPRRRLFDLSQRHDELNTRLGRAVRLHAEARRSRLATLRARLERRDPSLVLHGYRLGWQQLHQRLSLGATRALGDRRSLLAALARALETVSPMRTLDRGYAIVTRSRDGTLVRSSKQVRAGEDIDTRLAEGRLRATVKTRD
jgi:exodeoxyribonuclease VII large subunit